MSDQSVFAAQDASGVNAQLEKLQSSVSVNGDSLDRMVRRDEESNHGTTYVSLTVGLLCILQATLNICLRLYSSCPVLDSSCPVHNSSCPVLDSSCPVLDSSCPVHNSSCPVLDSVTVRTEERQREMDALGDLTRLGWLYYNHRLYYISTTEKNWTASRDDCLERDADLVVINSREEQEFVSRLAGYHWFWIGLSDRDTEGTWKWVDGTNMTSSFWRRGQPDDYGGQDCVVTLLGDNWRDVSCADQYHWMCEKVLVLDHLEAELNKEVMREEAPQIYDLPSSKMLSVGNTASFSCRAWGRPQPTIQWLLDGRLLETNGTDNRSASVVRMDGENLVLRGVRSGVETVLCMATNSAGTANHTAWLFVYEVRPDGWRYYDHSLYYISTTEKNWTASRDYCLERDADLVVFNSREEEEFVMRQTYYQWFWIGLSAGDTEGTWKWVDGTIMTSSFWISGQPNKYGGEDCVATWKEFGWDDDRCAALFPWICEKV
ncbi:CD209 antigen-like protein E [Merluccius polli]|uniref:CD209 antigen-like protein E n=1 Tax=Merluccius polli TaxID=89951 RepID=A0AA47N1L7_MERPO|nr:CD209 antigen-like protein E [Merluccius polli]